MDYQTLTITAERAALAVEAVRGRADTSAPRTRYQWVGGADGDLFEVEDTETKPVESKPFENINPNEEF